jgi:hypothetical protein
MVEQSAAPAPESYTIREFCRLERISEASFFKMARLGVGPKVLTIPGCAIKRITVKAREDWHRKIELLDRSPTVRQEQARRREGSRRAARIAIKSAKHVSNLTSEQRAEQRRQRELARARQSASGQ